VKIRFWAALFVVSASLLALNLMGSPDRTAALKKADQDWAKTVTARNLDQFMSYIGDDAYMCDLSGKWMHGKDSIKADWTKPLADPGFNLNWTVESADVSRDGTLGYTRGSFQGGQGSTKFAGSYATVWKKDKDGRWRVAVDIAASQSGQ
jgi:ketosteroid isomerase-like protein